MAKSFIPEEEHIEEHPLAPIESRPLVPENKKVDLKAWRERKLLSINKMTDAGKAKKAAERVFRNKEA